MIHAEESQKFYQKPLVLNSVLLGVNLGLFIFKLIFAYLTNSLALQADGFDNFTDFIMGLAAFIGIYYANKRPNEKFPYGYYKMENIISLIISLFIFFTAYQIISQSISDFISFFEGETRYIIASPEIFIFLILSSSVSAALTLYLFIVGKKSGSPIIESEANEKLYDNLISLSVIVGFIGALFNLYLLDSIIGIIIALFIVKGGYDIFISSTRTLLDAVIDFEDRTELYEMIESFPRVKDIQTLDIRAYGRYIFIEVEIILNQDLALSKIDHLKDKMTAKIKHQYPKIFKVIILINSPKKSTLQISAPLKDNKGVHSEISEHFGESPYFAFVYFEETEIKDVSVKPNEFKDREKRKGILISDWLSSEKIDKLYLKGELKKGPKLVFENSLVEIELTDAHTLEEIIRQEKNQLKK